ncbi:hypothetical protein [Mycolicibacterium obuense]|uniref:hypothetical protein n=1 Tax=Mycolicibacterium obuense TaxID=1807 RepID=UPI001038DC94|nr:hypothetical protein [Mycolicibacterium obuense]
MDAETFSRALMHVGRNEGPALLYDLYPGAIDIAEHSGVAAEVWSMAEFPSNLIDPDDWVALFEEAGYTVDGVPAPRPTAPVNVYRGCHPERRFGMSWTTDIDRARWFAERDLGHGVGEVYEVTVQPSFLLAYIHVSSRGEAEFVVDPSALDDERGEIGARGCHPAGIDSNSLQRVPRPLMRCRGTLLSEGPHGASSKVLAALGSHNPECSRIAATNTSARLFSSGSYIAV